MSPLNSLDSYIAASKQRVTYVKTASITTVAAIPFTMLNIAGNPGTGTLAGTSTTTPVMPTDNTAGFPIINFTSGSTYISKLEYSSSVAGRMQLFDLIHKSGIYGYVSGSYVISSPLDLSSRATDYNATTGSWGYGLEVWAEVTGAYLTGTSLKLQAIYKNQNGVSASGIFTAAYAAAALTANRMFQLNLASGDNGIQQLNSIVLVSDGTTYTAGSCNILVMRPLSTTMRIPIANAAGTQDMLSTGLPMIYNATALYPIFQPDSTTLGLNELTIELSNVTS